MTATNALGSPTAMSPAFRNFLLWLLGSLLMTVFTMMTLSAAYADGQYIPAHADAFYHARRILDVVMTGQPVMQFDPRMHVPEGSWVTWPWAYDSALAAITRLFGPYPNEAAANVVLMHIPVVFGVLAVAAVVWAAHLLRLGFLYSLILVVAFVGLPAVHANYSVGDVDHHSLESLWTSLTFCTGIWFFRNPGRLGPAIALGLVLGSACGVHVSLFILQLPVVGLYLLRWLRGQDLPSRRATCAFAITLLLTTLAISLPSEPFQRGFFEFYTLSWFHLYIAAGTALFTVLPVFLARRGFRIALVLILAVLALIPLLAGLDLGASFLGGNIDTIQDIMEIRSPYVVLMQFEGRYQAPALLYVLWIALPALLFNLYLLVTERKPGLQFFALAATMGLVLLQLQSRLHVFGDLALVATPLLAARLASDRWPQQTRRVALLVCALFAVLLIPMRHAFGLRWQLAGTPGYAEIRGVFPVMKAACHRRPGVLLADTEAGHWVRYFSECSVIGNVFLLTPQQAAKARETDQLMTLAPLQLLASRPDVSYILAYHNAPVDPRNEPDLEALRHRLPQLEGALLGPVDTIPAEFKLLWGLNTPGGQTYARLFEIVRGGGTDRPTP